jgi:hypothetical protein
MSSNPRSVRKVPPGLHLNRRPPRPSTVELGGIYTHTHIHTHAPNTHTIAYNHAYMNTQSRKQVHLRAFVHHHTHLDLHIRRAVLDIDASDQDSSDESDRPAVIKRAKITKLAQATKRGKGSTGAAFKQKTTKTQYGGTRRYLCIHAYTHTRAKHPHDRL